jgi:hypothetical protein
MFRYFDKEPTGQIVGLYGHDREDCRLFFDELDFDFIKMTTVEDSPKTMPKVCNCVNATAMLTSYAPSTPAGRRASV